MSPAGSGAGDEHGFRLAQLNVGRLIAPLGSPQVEGFESQLDEVNALAEASPGFVWRLQDDDGNATGIRAFEDQRLIVNLSIWESVEALRKFVYAVPEHKGPLRRRAEWFEPMDGAHLVLWWLEAGTIPSVEEAQARLLGLRVEGPTPRAFTFRESFPPPGPVEEDEQAQALSPGADSAAR